MREPPGPLWGRAASCCCVALSDVWRCLLPRQISGRRVACLGGPGRCVCRWAAARCMACCPDRSPAAAWPARPLAVRAASFARRVVSKPGQAPQAPRRPPIGRGLSFVCRQALPPPTGTAAWPANANRPAAAFKRAVLIVCALSARPRHRPPVPRPGPAAAHQFRMQFPHDSFKP